MAPGFKRFLLTSVQGMGAVFFLLQMSSVRADGRLFALGSRNSSQGLDLAAAQKSCADLGARLATAEELRRAVLDCSFAVCARGWLADGTIGTMVCSKTGSKQQNVKAIDVKIETNPFLSGRYDALCVKDEDKPCGDPPSFPHTILHGHTGFEMGDELLYVCAQGYIMGNKETAFTLLCDSCGEWYGQVQACIKVLFTQGRVTTDVTIKPEMFSKQFKGVMPSDMDRAPNTLFTRYHAQDEAEAHIDYEDNFPDDRSMPITEHKDDSGKEEKEQGQEQDFSLSEDIEPESTGSNEGVTEAMDSIEKGSKAPTESPVSLLSLKHLFWFPAEDFNNRESEKNTDDFIKTQFSDGDNHIGVKTIYSEPDAKMIYDSEDFPIGPVLVNNDTTAAKDTFAITDESWLDGYPVTQEVMEDVEEKEDKVDSSMGTEDDIIFTNDQQSHVEVRKVGNTSYPEKDLTKIVASSPRMHGYEVKEMPIVLTPTSAPENVSASKGFDDIIKYHLTTSLGFVTRESATTTTLYDPTRLKTATLETHVTVSPFNHIPDPKAEQTTANPIQVATTVSTRDDITHPSSKELIEQEAVTHGTGEKRLPTSEPCVGEECPRSSKGPMIAVIVIVLCLLLLAFILAVWFFKKRQQKSSVYKLNGKGQTRHHHQQHIEMQKV